MISTYWFKPIEKNVSNVTSMLEKHRTQLSTLKKSPTTAIDIFSTIELSMSSHIRQLPNGQSSLHNSRIQKHWSQHCDKLGHNQEILCRAEMKCVCKFYGRGCVGGEGGVKLRSHPTKSVTGVKTTPRGYSARCETTNFNHQLRGRMNPISTRKNRVNKS